jgi:hypothetical protein
MKQTPRVGRKSTDKLSVGLPGQLGQSESAIAKGMYPPQLLSAGYGRHEWGDIHTWVAYFGIILAVVHLGLNWQWLVKVAASKHIWRLAGGILLGLLIVVAFLLLPLERA